MAKSFSGLRAKMSPEAQQRSAVKTKAMMKEMALAELHQARRLSQEQIAEKLHIKQAAVSKLEKRTDMYISSLRRFVEAMGGELEIVVTFPEGEVKITQFEDLDGAAA